MTFAAQIRRTVVWAVACVALSLVIAAIGPSGPAVIVMNVLVAAGACLAVFGVAGRWLHRWLWQHVIWRSSLSLGGRRYADYLTGGALAPFWRWWLHVDATGADRDAMPAQRGRE